MDQLTTIISKALSRRSFLAGAGSVAATALVAGCSDDVKPFTPTPSPVLSDTDILNFALNLEYLEAEFYLHAATGTGLSDADSGGTGTVTAGGPVPGLTAAQTAYMNEFAEAELSHVRFLRSQLGSAAVNRPDIDITGAFNTIAAALGLGSFDPYASFANFLVGGFTFEDVGVTAYTGAAPLLSSTTILGAAAGIQALEAYHAASLRSSITAMTITPGSDQTPLTTAIAISNFRATLGGGNETTPASGVTYNGSVPTVTASAIVQADPTNSIGYARTPSQVLHIVYGTGGGEGVAKGGFFPSGVNGNIKITAA